MRRAGVVDDHKIEAVIGNLLRTGVLMAAFVVLVGGILYLAQHGSSSVDFRVFHGETGELNSIAGIVQGAVALHPLAIIQLGLLLLIATPIARVFFSVFAFALQRDYLYLVVTLIVLSALLYSLLGKH
jgi:uncharacterized membrane protein